MDAERLAQMAAEATAWTTALMNSIGWMCGKIDTQQTLIDKQARQIDQLTKYLHEEMPKRLNDEMNRVVTAIIGKALAKHTSKN